jgi:phosphatidylserine decarboxylase
MPSLIHNVLAQLSGHIVYKLSRVKVSWFKLLLIKIFIWANNIDISELLDKDLKSYSNFNDFFIRRLESKYRPIDNKESQITSPADGTITEFGTVNDGKLIQAKDHYYDLSDLLGNKLSDQEIGTDLFLTIYLSPQNYHRIHMPFDGEVIGAKYIPGEKYTVRPRTLKKVDRVFTKNERLILWLKSSMGISPLVMIGALNVASISTFWQEEFKFKKDSYSEVPPGKSKKQKGEELACFNLGSTVILLLPSSYAALRVSSMQPVKMGEAIAEYLP